MRAAFFALTLLFLAACAQRTPGDAAPRFASGSEWSIAAIDGDPLPAGVSASLRRDGDRVSGRGGCNRFAGGVTVAGDRVSFGPLISTRMACAPEAMQVESALHAAFGRVDGVRAGPEGGLELTAGAAAAVTLVPAPAG